MSQRKLKRIKKLQTEAIKKPEVFTGLRQSVIGIIKIHWKWLAIMTILIGGLYANSLNGAFVSDDHASIPLNPQIGDFWFMFDKGNSLSFSNYLLYKMFGFTSPVPYHLAAVLGFVVFCWISYLFLEIVFKNKWLTRLTMLLFVFHPIHAEAVTWISGRNYVIVANYVMLAMMGVVYYLKIPQKKYLIFSVVLFLLAFLTDKPRAFVIILLSMVYVLSVGIRNIKINWTKIIFGLIGFSSILVIVAWPYIQNRVNIVNSGYNSSESIFYNPFFQYPTGITKYLQLLWFPIDLTLYHTMFVFPGWLNWAIILTYLGITIYFYFKNRVYFFALAFIVAAVLPSIMPVKVSWLVAERYMFLGSWGFCLFLALVLKSIAKYNKVITAIILGIVISFYGVRLVMRNSNWLTNHDLWVNTCQVSPNSHNAWNNIGDDYDKLKDYDNAIKGFTQSTVVKPNYADAFHNRANIFFKIGRLDLARDSYNTAIYYSPELYQTYLSLTQIDLMEGKIDLAIEHASKAASLQPNNPQPAYVLAVVYAQAGKVDDAEIILKNILKSVPDYQPAIQVLQQLKIAVTNP